MWKVLLDEWARLSSESLQSDLNRNLLESYKHDDIISFYQNYVSKSEWVRLGVICVISFFFLSRFSLSSSHIFALAVIVIFFYLYGKSQVKSFTSDMVNMDTELRFLNAILFTYHTYDWQSQSSGIPNPETSMTAPIPENKSFLYLYPLAVQFYYNQRYLIYLHFGGFRDSLSCMNHIIEHWWLLKKTTRKDLLKAYYTWFISNCTKCVNHFAEIYYGLTLTPEYQENYRTALRQLEEIIQGLRNDATAYIDSVLGKTDIDHGWFVVESNWFPVANDSEVPDANVSHSYIPNQ